MFDDAESPVTETRTPMHDSMRGTLVHVRGSVIDAHFPLSVPDLKNELRSGDDGDVVIEMVNHLDSHTVRDVQARSANLSRKQIELYFPGLCHL